MADSGSRTEKATPKKRRDERKKGNIFSSKDIVTVVSIFAVFGVLKVLFPFIIEKVTSFFQTYMQYAQNIGILSQSRAEDILFDCLVLFAITVMPLLVVSTLATVIATGGQTRFLFAGEALKPKFNRLNPLQGFRKMFSLRSLVEVVKGLIKIVIVGAVAYTFVKDEIAAFAQTPYMSLTQSIAYVLNSVLGLVFRIGLIFIFIAMLDYLYQWWDYEQQLKMTKQEVKEEYKQVEGDPQVKAHIRDIQRRFAMSRMMQAVPTADVIIRNPTHYAVALKYDLQKDAAPVVVAKGKDHLALRIIEVAEEHGVHTTENRPLARALYESVDLNREIPMEYYGAIAEILAIIYQMNQKRKE